MEEIAGTNSFQRIGSVSNAHVGRDFESIAKGYFRQQGIILTENYVLSIGVCGSKKNHQFDLGCSEPPLLVECKSHRWTSSDNTPSAKITVWNEAMYYFHLAPVGFRKIFFVLRDFSPKRRLSLAEYYVRNHGHLIPKDVEILEYDEEGGEVIEVLLTGPAGPCMK